jgi:hypothetical protein
MYYNDPFVKAVEIACKAHAAQRAIVQILEEELKSKAKHENKVREGQNGEGEHEGMALNTMNAL